MIRAVVLDAYGTLLDTGTGSVAAAGEILRRAGRRDPDPAAFYARWKQIHRQHLVCPDGFVTEAEIYARDLAQLYREYGIAGDAARDVAPMLAIQGTRSPFAEVPSVLRALRERVPVYIGSTTDTAPLLQDMARGGLEFDGLFTSESLRVYKPDPLFYRQILSALDLRPQEVLFAGDKLSDDVYAPAQVGMYSCWIRRRNEPIPDPAPPFILPDLAGLPAVLQEIARRDSGA